MSMISQIRTRLTKFGSRAQVPTFTFSDLGTVTEQRLKDPDARLVFTQKSAGGNTSDLWVVSLDGKNVQKVTVPGKVNAPLNDLAYGWIFVKYSPSTILAYDYVSKRTVYISLPSVAGYEGNIFHVYFSPKNIHVTYDVSYVRNDCDRQAGCKPYFDLPGAKGGVYAYNMETGKTTYLGLLDYSTYVNRPKWKDDEDSMYTSGAGKLTKIDLKTGNREDISLLSVQLPDSSVSPNEKNMLRFVKHDPAQRGGILELVNRNTLARKTLLTQSNTNQITCSRWVSNTTVFCQLRDDIFRGDGEHHFLLNVETGKTQTLLPDDSLKGLQ